MNSIPIEIVELWQQGRKVEAIKQLCEYSGMGLKDAKDLLETLDESQAAADAKAESIRQLRATRDQTLALPVQDAAAIRQAAGQCLKRVPLGKRMRLLGVKVSGLISEQAWQESAHDPVARESLLRPQVLTSVKNSDPYTASLF